jgi:hypothetical protein
MTGRQRFLETIRYGRPDRVPYFEEGIRDEVLERWRKQGLPEGTDVSDLLPTDHRERIGVNLEPIPPLDDAPAYELTVAELRARLDPTDERRLPDDWEAKVAAWRDRDHVLELPLHRGYFLSMGVRGWARFPGAVYPLKDDPAKVRAILDTYAECYAVLADRILSQIDVDMVSFSEPIGGNDGPLLGPSHYETFCLESYRGVMETCRRHGVPVLTLVTYANARDLVGSILKYGFDCLWGCEVNVDAMDYRSLRQEFGRDLRLIGGIDLDALLGGKESIRHEVMAKVPPLLEQGGYVPLADGRVRENVPFENYRYYRELLAEVCGR